jgi:hypothetical protein
VGAEPCIYCLTRRRKPPNENEGFPPVVKLIYRGTLILSFLANGIVQPYFDVSILRHTHTESTIVIVLDRVVAGLLVE